MGSLLSFGVPPSSPLRRRNLWTPDTSFVFVTIKGRLVLKRNISHSPFRSADEWEKMFANWYVIPKEATNSGHSYFSRSSLDSFMPHQLYLYHTANLAHLPRNRPKWAELAVLFSW